MSKIEIDAGQSSSATHRLTQPSTTLNRHYVKRPTNLVIEEAARQTKPIIPSRSESTTPSRLVNLRIRAAELEAAKAAEAAQQAQVNSYSSYPGSQCDTPSAPVMMVPNVVELGYAPEPTLESPAQSATLYSAPAVPDPTYNPAPMMPTASAMSPMPSAPAATEMPAASNPASLNTSDLAMSIAADYAAASIGASLQNHTLMMPSADSPDSVDAIAQAASDAIASIREATEPSQVSEQVASLKAFADNIKSSPNLPEMKALSDTIDKFVSIAMKSTKVQEETAKKAAAAPVKVALSPKANRAAAKVTKSSAKIMANNAKRVQRATNMSRQRVASRKSAPRNHNNQQLLTPEDLKDRAIEKALHSVATMDAANRQHQPRTQPMRYKRKGGAKRFAIAFACAAICVGGIVAFISANIPDISVRVAAMQTGITAAYPSYIPRDYNPGDIYSEEGKISMVFNGPNGSSFTLVEEKSSWDSSALLRNFVEPTWGDEYATTHEQGITIYIANDSSDAAWVNGGVLYKITSAGTPLTKKQVRSIVTSL